MLASRRLADRRGTAAEGSKDWRALTRIPGQAGCVDRGQRGLDDLGYVEGRTHTLELRWAKDRVDLLPSLAADLVRLKVDVIVASSQAAGVVKEATTSIPIFWASSIYPSRPESS